MSALAKQKGQLAKLAEDLGMSQGAVLESLIREKTPELVLCAVCGEEKRPHAVSPNCRCELCPDCKNVPMVSRGSIPGTAVGTYLDESLFQCPKCKTVDIR